MKQQVNIRVSEATRTKLDELSIRYGTQAEVVAVAVDRLYQTERRYTMRKFIGHSQEIVGEHTAEELEAVRQIGAVNAYRQPLYDVLSELQQKAPAGWQVISGPSTHNETPQPPVDDAILLGWVRVIHGDPAFPIWAYRQD